MTTNLIDHSPAVVAAIHEAFHLSQPCHCTDRDGKLSEDELLDVLVRHRYIHYADLHNLECLPIRDLMYRFPNDCCYELEKAGVSYLPQLTDWTYTDLLRLPDVGPAKADATEALMARFGLMLKDSNPRRLAELQAEQQEEEAEPEARRLAGTPKDIRETVAKELVNLAQRMMSLNVTLMKQAIRIAAGEKAAGMLGKTLRCSLDAQREARSLIRPLRSLEDQEATPKPVKPRRPRATAKPAPRVEHRGSVVTGAFPQAAAGD